MYDTEIIGGFTVHIEEGMDNYHSSWRSVLTRDIERVIDALPGPALEIVKDTRIYLHKKYIYPGKDDSDGAAVSFSIFFIEKCIFARLFNFLLLKFSGYIFFHDFFDVFRLLDFLLLPSDMGGFFNQTFFT